MNDLPEALELLSSRVEALEKRIEALEHPAEMRAAAVQELPTSAAEKTVIEEAGSVFPVLGKAMLGIAGAYLLRAVMESSTLPKTAVAAVAVPYALGWLVWASRATAMTQFARTVYAGTSALILAPMLWELTLRFQVLSPSMAAAVLGVFVVAATALTWKSDVGAVMWMAYGAAACTALALSIATHVILPFLTMLLVMVALCEYAAGHDRAHGIRPLVALVTDVAVWALIFIYSGPASARTDYPALGTAALLTFVCLLFVVNATGVAMKTMRAGQQIAGFEALQAVIAFLLAATGVFFFAPQSGPRALGVGCLVLSAASYTAAFGVFERAAERRNFRVFSNWSAGLLLAALVLGLPVEWAAACLGMAALLATFVGVRQGWTSLEFHGSIYLVAAAIVSGLLEYTFSALAGPMRARPSWSIFLVSAFAVTCYAVGRERVGEAWKQQVLHFVPAALATGAVAALIAQGLVNLLALAIIPDVFHVAFIRTLTMCSVALALALGGSLWERLEMTRIAYAALGFVAAKLFFEDLRYGRMEFIAGSIFLVALTLIAVPRLARMRHGIRHRT
jgi:hypothetical protein